MKKTTKKKTVDNQNQRYILQWNFGTSQCGFNTKKDVIDFIRKTLSNFETSL